MVPDPLLSEYEALQPHRYRFLIELTLCYLPQPPWTVMTVRLREQRTHGLVLRLSFSEVAPFRCELPIAYFWSLPLAIVSIRDRQLDRYHYLAMAQEQDSPALSFQFRTFAASLEADGQEVDDNSQRL